MPPANGRAAEARGLICALRAPRMQLLKVYIRTLLPTLGLFFLHLGGICFIHRRRVLKCTKKRSKNYETTKSRFVLMSVLCPTCSLSLLLILIILTQSCGISLIPAVPTVESFCSLNMSCGHFTSLLTTMFRSESLVTRHLCTFCAETGLRAQQHSHCLCLKSRVI